METGHVVTHSANSLGCSWGDLNGDNYPDLYVANYNSNNNLYINNGDGTFSNITTGAVVNNSDFSIICSIIDINNDYRNDIVVGNDQYTDNKVYLQDVNGNFITDIATALGPNTSTYSLAWSDINFDGNLDVFMGSWIPYETNNFLLGSDDGSFVEFSCSPASYLGTSYGANWLDLNDDGLDDLFVLNEDEQPCIYYNNDGDGFIQHLGSHDIIDNVPKGNSVTWGDLNNDGLLDLYITGIMDAQNHLFYNQGSGSFVEDNSDFSLVNGEGLSRACAMQDFDNNGWLDIYVVNYYNNSLFLNNGDGTFTNVLDDISVEDSEITVAVAASDYDLDGDVDMYLVTGTGVQSDQAQNTLYENICDNGNNWLNVLLTGNDTRTYAVGAEVRLLSDLDNDGNSEWQIRKNMSQTSRNSQDDSTCHFGLGSATMIDSLIVSWPGGTESVVSGIDLDSTIHCSDYIGIGSRLMLNDVSTYPGETASIPLSIFNIRDMISSFDITLNYSQQHLQFTGLTGINSILAYAGWEFSSEVTNSGLHISGSGEARIINLGQLCKLDFVLLDTEDVNSITISNATYNESSSFEDNQYGHVLLNRYFPGDSSLDYCVDQTDVMYILEECIGNEYFLNCQIINADVSLNGTVSALDAAIVNSYLEGTIDCLPNTEILSQLEPSLHPVPSEIIAYPTEQLSVPLCFEECEDVLSFELVLSYESEVINVSDLNLRIVPGNWQYAYCYDSSQIRIAAAGTSPLFQSVTVGNLNLSFVENTAFDSTFISVVSLTINEDYISYYGDMAIIYNQNTPNEESLEIPTSFSHYPNPFSASNGQNLTFMISSKDIEENVSLSIYNLKGQKVKTIEQGYVPRGLNSFTWDGKTNSGSKAASGVYFYKYSSSKRNKTGKILIVK
jgi:hypothetical protein